MQSALAEHGFDYPYSYSVIGPIVTWLAAFGAVVQRDQLVPPGWALLGVGVVLLPHIWFFVNRWIPRTVFAFFTIAGTAIMLVHPVDGDLAPILLIAMCTMVAATSTTQLAVVVTVASTACLIVVAATIGLAGASIYVSGVLFGTTVGMIIQNQLRLIEQERSNVETRAARAAVEERSRIAREVHDVVAHSLSITLLHITGARRALEVDADIPDAVDALTDAERIGRRAMADIRRTVGLLDSGPSKTTPEPALVDIDNLVDDFRRAGLAVRYEVGGEPESVSAATGMQLYRVTQESLTNIVKHAPGAAADVRVDISPEAVSLTVLNDVPHEHPASTTGNGLRGMRHRIEALGGKLATGPDDAGWAVRAQVPLTLTSRSMMCRLRGLLHE